MAINDTNSLYPDYYRDLADTLPFTWVENELTISPQIFNSYMRLVYKGVADYRWEDEQRIKYQYNGIVNERINYTVRRHTFTRRKVVASPLLPPRNKRARVTS